MCLSPTQVTVPIRTIRAEALLIEMSSLIYKMGEAARVLLA